MSTSTEAPNSIKVVVFDLGNTVLRELPQFQSLGLPMAQWPTVETVEGVEPALQALHGKFRLCVASNSIYRVEFTAMALQRARVRQFFERVFNSHEFGVAKPEAGFFLKILEQMQVQAAEAIIVGDSYQKDIVPAKDLGFRTIYFREAFSASPVPASDAVISQMHDLPGAVTRLNGTDGS